MGGGGIYNKINAFTLIELLAIIIILAIIAVITVPIILNVIENAKKGAAVDSAYGYKDAIEKYYLTELSKDSDFGMNGKYTIGEKGKLIGEANEDGTILTHEIPFSGTIPSEGSISIENNTVKTACLVIDEYKIELQDGKFVTTGKGECDSEPKVVFGGKVVTGEDLAALEGGYTGVKAIVYLDPTNLATECDEVIAASNVKENGSPTGINTGCMKWYAIDILSDNDTYTMILDHNTSDPVAWVSQDDYEQTTSKTATPSEVGISYYSEKVTMTEDGQLPAGTWSTSSGTNNRGPITLLKQLQEDTKNWIVAETLTSSDTYTAEWEAIPYSNYSGTQKYTINYTGYKARLISGEEINRITGKDTNTVSAIQTSYFDSNCGSSGCSKGTNKYAWLLDHTGNGSSQSCESKGCNAGFNFDNNYWTSSPSAMSSYSAWYVGYSGCLNSSNVSNTAVSGVRPVVKISASDLGL